MHKKEKTCFYTKLHFWTITAQAWLQLNMKQSALYPTFSHIYSCFTNVVMSLHNTNTVPAVHLNHSNGYNNPRSQYLIKVNWQGADVPDHLCNPQRRKSPSQIRWLKGLYNEPCLTHPCVTDTCGFYVPISSQYSVNFSLACNMSSMLH
jgi:hypothetical protein